MPKYFCIVCAEPITSNSNKGYAGIRVYSHEDSDICKFGWQWAAISKKYGFAVPASFVSSYVDFNDSDYYMYDSYYSVEERTGVLKDIKNLPDFW
jgi:hypothetical protein